MRDCMNRSVTTPLAQPTIVMECSKYRGLAFVETKVHPACLFTYLDKQNGNPICPNRDCRRPLDKLNAMEMANRWWVYYRKCKSCYQCVWVNKDDDTYLESAVEGIYTCEACKAAENDAVELICVMWNFVLIKASA